MIDESYLRVLLMFLLTLLCYSVWKVIRSRINVSERSKKLKGSWVKNKHCRSVKEAEFFFTEALAGIAPNMSFNANLDGDGK